MDSYFTSYPLFRLSVALAAGIFLSDRFPAGMDSLPIFLASLFVAVVVTFFLFPSKKYCDRSYFGVSTAVSFLLLGYVLHLLAGEDVRYSWLPEEAFYVGTIVDVPHERPRTVQAIVHVESVRDTNSLEQKKVDRDIMLYWVPDSTQAVLRCGDRIGFRSRIGKPLSDAELTGFDYGRYLERQGISGTCVAFAGNWFRLSSGSKLTWRQKALLFREKIVAKYRSWGLDDEVLAVVSALTVGDKAELTRELKATYSAAGVSHILALSGLHVGIFAMILSWLLRPLRRIRGGRWMIGVCIVSVLWTFAFISGLSPSVVRAVTMFSFYMLISVTREEYASGWVFLSLTAFLMLLYRPMNLFDISFQLSFVAVASILLFYPMFRKVWKPRNKFLSYVWTTLAVSVSAQLGTLPLILYYFGTFPTYFLVANLVVSPLAVCILAASLAALALSPFPFLAMWAVAGLDYAVKVLNGTMKLVQQWEGAQLTSVYLSEGQAWLLALVIVMLWTYLLRHSVRRMMGVLLALNLLMAWVVAEQLREPEKMLYLSRSGVYVKQGRQAVELSSSSRIYQVGDIRIVLLDDAGWRNKQAQFPLEADYVYVCRGFRGSIVGLKDLFHVGKVVFDDSLGENFKASLIRECKEMNLEYVDLSGRGVYPILL